MGSTIGTVRAFPAGARQRAGYQLYLVQQGLDPNDWKPLPSVGPGVREIRVHIDGEYRVFYVAKFAEAIYILHAFEKRTRRTRQQADIELAKKHLSEVTRLRLQK
ncbi:MAG: type II toxin-antitoxin system RelE/ParE family toxin [Acidobacteriota bacterium]